jgi:hypothetical protein
MRTVAHKPNLIGGLRMGAVLALFCLLFSACAPVAGRGISEEKKGRETIQPSVDHFPLWEPCNREQARKWGSPGAGPELALRAASCYAVLAQKKENPSSLSDAAEGLDLAEKTSKRFPENGLAHYLYAVLAGLKAEREPLKGLGMVPVIQREASAAARLDPEVDKGGPDRVLGDLYLQAPGFPVSIGDPSRAVTHYRIAVGIAPVIENRFGLTSALLATGDSLGACRELRGIFKDLPPTSKKHQDWNKSLDLLGNLCDSLAGP